MFLPLWHVKIKILNLPLSTISSLLDTTCPLPFVTEPQFSQGPRSQLLDVAAEMPFLLCVSWKQSWHNPNHG